MKRLLFFLLLTQVAAAETHLAIMGGGGEPNTDTTIFDEDLKSLGALAKSDPAYKTQVSFNGGHSVTEKIAKENFPSYDAKNHFTKQSYEDMIKGYEEKIKSGAIKPGDQLLLHINTHGSQKSKETHNIATSEGTISNYDTLGSETVSMDRLKELTKLAEKKGVKLAILDMSCHSGVSLALANSKTCVITSTGPNHYAYGGSSTTFSGRFSKKLQKGKSLEDAFLEARADFNDMGFPMISSPQGNDVQSRLYQRITPYLFSYDQASNKFSPFMEAEAAKGEKCDLSQQHDALIAEAEGILKIVGESSKVQVEAFKQAVDAYYGFLDGIRKKMLEVGFAEMKKKHEFCSSWPANKKTKVKAGKECVDYTTENLLTLEFDKISEYFANEAVKEKSPQDRARYQATVEYLKKAREKRDEILKEHPEYLKIKDFWATMPKLQTETYKLGYKVAKAQQKVYDHLYRQSKVTGPNPCKDFVL